MTCKNKFGLSPEDSEKLIHELQVHQLELEMQNEELRRTEAELSVTKSRYFELFDLAPMGYLTISGEGRIVEANLTAAHLFNLPRNSLGGKSLTSFIFPEDQDIYYRHWKDLFETEEPQYCELRMLKKNSGHFHVALRAVLSSDTEGVKLCKAVLSDITDKYITNAKIAQLLSEKDLMLREFRHRVKNNMHAISGLISLQMETTGQPEVTEALRNLEGRIQSMMVLYENLDKFTDLQSMRVKDYLIPLLQRIVGMFPNSGMVKVATSIEDFSLNSHTLSTLGIMLNEIITNSMKYAFNGMDEGEISVNVSKKEETVTLVIGDNGCGLRPSPDDKRRLAEAENGLGLKLVRMLTDQLGGTLQTESEYGFRFTITLKEE